jgi:hypothetical protein
MANGRLVRHRIGRKVKEIAACGLAFAVAGSGAHPTVTTGER